MICRRLSEMVCDNCKVKDECDGWANIQQIQSLADEILPEYVCDNINIALEAFSYCEYKE